MIQSNKMVFARNLIALLLCLLVFSRSAGFLFDLHSLNVLGRSLMVSPLPMPFGTYNQYENFSTHILVTVKSVSGATQTIDIDEAYKKLIGPHRVQIPFMWALQMGPVYPLYITKPIYEKNFCEDYFDIFSASVVGYEIGYLSKVDQTKFFKEKYLCQ